MKNNSLQDFLTQNTNKDYFLSLSVSAMGSTKSDYFEGSPYTKAHELVARSNYLEQFGRSTYIYGILWDLTKSYVGPIRYPTFDLYKDDFYFLCSYYNIDAPSTIVQSRILYSEKILAEEPEHLEKAFESIGTSDVFLLDLILGELERVLDSE